MQENIWLLDEEEDDGDFMLTVTLLHAVKRHKKNKKAQILDTSYFLGRENNLAQILI